MQLVWSTESALLGLWGVVLSQYSTSLHAFVSISQLGMACFTLLLHLFASSQDWRALGHAASESYVCGVFALILVYAVVLLDPSKYNTFFSINLSSIAGPLPIDACVGLGWFSAVTVSALGMALSERGRRTPLMFHHFGYHVMTVVPCLVILWLYYTGDSNNSREKSDPLSYLLQTIYHVARKAFFLFITALWFIFIFLQATGEQIDQLGGDLPLQEWEFVIYRLVPAVLKLFGRALPVLLCISAAIVAQTKAQSILALVLLGISAANVLDFLDMAKWVRARWRSLIPAAHGSGRRAAMSARANEDPVRALKVFLD